MPGESIWIAASAARLLRQRVDRGGMAERGAVGLIAQIGVNRFVGKRLASVPHDRGEKPQVGGGQRSAEQRQLGGRGISVGIVDLHQFERGARGHADTDPDEPFLQQHARRGATGWLPSEVRHVSSIVC
jgi:hypothetical protein